MTMQQYKVMCLCVHSCICVVQDNTHMGGEHVGIWKGCIAILCFTLSVFLEAELFLSFFFFFVTSKLKLEDLMRSINTAQELALWGPQLWQCKSQKGNNEIFRQKSRASGETMKATFTLGPFEHQVLNRKSKGQRPSSGCILPGGHQAFLGGAKKLADSRCQQMTVIWIDGLRKSLFLRPPGDSCSQGDDQLRLTV